MTAPTFAVLGIDVSSTAIDIVALDENTDRAEWTRLPLTGATPFARCRNVAGVMKPPGWYEHRGVYLAAIEKPRSRFIKSLAAQLPIFGAVVACLPDTLEVFEFPPWEWREQAGLRANATKDEVADWVRERWIVTAMDANFPLGPLPQDALDAYCIAYAAREMNAKAIVKAAADRPYWWQDSDKVLLLGGKP